MEFKLIDYVLTNSQSLVVLLLFSIVFTLALMITCICCHRKSCEVPDCPDNPGPHMKKSLKLKASFLNGSAIQSVQGIEMSIVARNDQVITFNPAFEDGYGNPVDVLGSNPVWSLSNQDVAVLSVSEDGKQATVTPTGATGTVQLNLLVDADPGEAEEPLVGIADIQIVAGKARIIKLVGLVSDKVAVVSPEPEPETPAVPPEGTIVSTKCNGTDKYNVVADGNGGEQEVLAESNSPDCGA